MSDSNTLAPHPTLPPASQAAIEAALIGEGWRYTTAFRGPRWDTTVRLQAPCGEPVFLELLAYRDYQRVMLFLTRRIRVTDATRTETLRLLNQVNAALQITTFLLDPHRDEVELRGCIAEDLAHPITAESVGGMISLACGTDREYSPLIRDVAEGRRTAREALDAIVIARNQLTLDLTT